MVKKSKIAKKDIKNKTVKKSKKGDPIIIHKKGKAIKNHKKGKSVTKDADIEKLIREQVAKTGKNLSEEEKEDQFKALKAVFVEGKEPMEAMELPEDFIKLLYQQAYDLYNLGLYNESNHTFRILCLLAPLSARHHMGLAATNHQMGNYEIAAAIYFASYFLDPSSPIPLVYISDCFMNLDQPGCAYFVLRMAAETCGTQQEYATVKPKCYQMMKALQEQYGIHKEEKPGVEEGVEEGVEKGVEEGEVDVFSQLQNQAEDEAKGAA